MRLQENGINTDYFLRNNQESLVSKDKTEQRFTLQHWYEGKECDTKSGRYFKKCPDTGKVTYFNENGTCGGITGKDLSGRNIFGTIRSFVRYANLYGTKEHPMYLRKIIWQVWSSFLKGHSMQ